MLIRPRFGNACGHSIGIGARFLRVLLEFRICGFRRDLALTFVNRRDELKRNIVVLLAYAVHVFRTQKRPFMYGLQWKVLKDQLRLGLFLEELLQLRLRRLAGGTFKITKLDDCDRSVCRTVRWTVRPFQKAQCRLEWLSTERNQIARQSEFLVRRNVDPKQLLPLWSVEDSSNFRKACRLRWLDFSNLPGKILVPSEHLL